MSVEKEKEIHGEEWKQRIPPGFRFCPTDQEILQHYLLSYVNGKFILPGIIRRLDVYERNPYHLPGIDTKEKFTYFFTDRARKYQNGFQADRVTRDGKGHWKSTSTKTEVYAEDGSYLGKKNTLVYYVNNPVDQKDIKTNWIMHEFLIAKYLVSPSTSSAQLQQEHYDGLIACRIHENESKSNKQKISERKDLINSLIGPNPITTDHNNGEPPVQPSLKRKIEPHQETLIACDYSHDTAMNSNYYLYDTAMNSNYYLDDSQELQAAVILGNMTTTYEFGQSSNTTPPLHDDVVVGPTDQVQATVYQEHRCPQQNLEVVDEVRTEENILHLGELSGGDDLWDILKTYL